MSDERIPLVWSCVLADLKTFADIQREVGDPIHDSFESICRSMRWQLDRQQVQGALMALKRRGLVDRAYYGRTHESFYWITASGEKYLATTQQPKGEAQ